MKRKILNLVLVLLFVIAILMPTSNSTAIADELGYASEQQEERGIFDILKNTVSVQMGMSTSALATTPPSGTFITWDVSNPKIASVSSSGLVTGIRIGSTQLIAVISIPGLTTMTKTTTIHVTPDTFLFYIKNKNSGQYLSVQNNNDSENQNVIQAKHTDINNTSRLWMISRNSDGTYTITSKCGTSNRVLTIDLAGTTGTQNSLYAKIATNTGGANQKFNILLNYDNTTHKITTKCSSESKCLSVVNASCESGARVFQYTYGSSRNDEWLLIPYMDINNKFLLNYVTANYQTYDGSNISGMYPFLIEADCANFISQCLIAGGIKSEVDEWFLYRKNTSAALLIDMTEETGIDSFDAGWDSDTIGTLRASSPWIHARRFYEFWSDRVIGSPIELTSDDILEDISQIENFDIGDVVQFYDPNKDNYPAHTMIITGKSGNIPLLSYHTKDIYNKSILTIIDESVPLNFVFLKFTL